MSKATGTGLGWLMVLWFFFFGIAITAMLCSLAIDDGPSEEYLKAEQEYIDSLKLYIKAIEEEIEKIDRETQNEQGLSDTKQN